MRRLGLLSVLLAALVGGLLHLPTADASTTSTGSLFFKLRVAPESGWSSYSRRHFEYPFDADDDTCDTREEVMLSESRVPVQTGAACRILAGRWFSSYDGATWTRPSDVELDHMLPFREAWTSGARRWTSLDRRRFANDLWFPWSINIVTDNVKAAKRSYDPAQWLPPKAKCFYVTRWIAVKYRWRLSIDKAERAALAKVLKGPCGRRRLNVPVRVTLGAVLPPLPNPTDSALPNTASNDTTPPSSPTAPSATLRGTSVSLSWRAATDNVGVTHYYVYRSGKSGFLPGLRTFIGSTTSTTYDDPSRPVGTGYYRVVAADAGGNVGEASSEAVAQVTATNATTVFAVGDIACPPGASVTATTCRHAEVGAVVAAEPEAFFVPLGDLQYLNATYAEFTGPGGYDSAFGAVKARTLPVIGNHEHVDPAGIGHGYFDYFYGPGSSTGSFGARKQGYYARTLGGWQFIALNSECIPETSNANRAVAGGCAVGSPQYEWLSSVLASGTARCTLVAFHRPRWTTGAHPSHTAMAPMWDLMVRAGVDVTISGHNHSSEVFTPIGTSGWGDTPRLVDDGVRSFVAGGGGKSFSRFLARSAAFGATYARDNSTFGPLRLSLGDGTYDWEFRPIAGQTFTNAGTGGYFAGSGESCR